MNLFWLVSPFFCFLLVAVFSASGVVITWPALVAEAFSHVVIIMIMAILQIKLINQPITFK